MIRNRNIYLSLTPEFAGFEMGNGFYVESPTWLRKVNKTSLSAVKAVLRTGTPYNNLIYKVINLFLMVILYIFNECTIR